MSRLAAFAFDIGVSWGLYTAALAVLALIIGLIAGTRFSIHQDRWLGIGIFLAWEFLYFAYQWSLSGKTLGMAFFGIQVVRADGAAINAKTAIIRTLALPLSFALLGLGLLGILFQRERRALHDGIAGTAVVYDWDARAARLRWLAKKPIIPADVAVPAIPAVPPSSRGGPQ